MSAVISECGAYRYRLERPVFSNCAWCGGVVGSLTRCNTCGTVAPKLPAYAFFGVNPSTADAVINDATVGKWIGFVGRWRGGRFLAGNLFGFRAADVAELSSVSDPMGPDNARHIAEIIAEADVLVPCWGSRAKLPKALRWRCDAMRDKLRASGKPVKVFGLTKGGDPLHPLFLGYDTQLTDWTLT